jgi:beta-lactam-binding protein with PASTA domain
MPQVRHLPLEVAEAAIHTANIPYRISRAQDQVVPEGVLISVARRPPPAAVIRPGDEVLPTVSCGPLAVQGER